MYEADSEMEAYLQRVYVEPESSPALSISSDDDTNSTQQVDGKYDSEHDSDVDMCIEGDMDTPYGVDLDGNVAMERDGDDEEEDEWEKDKEQEDEEEANDEEQDEEEEEEDEDDEQDEDEDDGEEHRMIGQGELVNTSADDVDTVVDDQPIMLPQQGQEMRERTPRAQPPATAHWP